MNTLLRSRNIIYSTRGIISNQGDERYDYEILSLSSDVRSASEDYTLKHLNLKDSQSI